MGTHSLASCSLLLLLRGDLLAQKAVHTVSQLLEIDDLRGWLTFLAGAALLAELDPFSLLQHNIRLLVQAIPKPSITDKLNPLATKPTLSFY
jgi:hypothetical protein